MSTIIKKTFDDQLLDALEEWRKQHPDVHRWDNKDVIRWMINKKQFGLERHTVEKELEKRLAKAQNRKRVRNKQNRRVRVYHAAKLPVRNSEGEMIQKTFWAHRLDLEASFAHKSMDQRQKQAAGLCRSMFNDAQDLNDNNENLKGNKIQLELDFSYITGDKPKQSVQVIPTDVPFVPTKEIVKKKPH